MDKFGWLITVIIFTGFIGVLSLASCHTDQNEAIRALTVNNFSAVVITDSGFLTRFHGCDESDGVWYEAEATNLNGVRVTATVCCGGPVSFKGCTIRAK